MRPLLAALVLLALPAIGQATPPAAMKIVGNTSIPISVAGLTEVCIRSGTPCGMIIDSLHPFDAAKRAEVYFASATVGEVLNAFIAQAPTYRWVEDGGVLRVEPRHPEPFVEKRLYQDRVSFSESGTLATIALFNVIRTLPRDLKEGSAASAGGSPHLRQIDVNIHEEGVVAAMDSIVAIDGHVIWMVTYQRLGPEFTFSFDFCDGVSCHVSSETPK